MDVREDLAYEEDDNDYNNLQKKKHINDSEENLKQSKCFKNFYLFITFLLSLSCFLDISAFLCYYQNNKNKSNFNQAIFYIRIVNDAVFILPMLIYLQHAIDITFKYFIVGIFTFLPQIILSTISLIMLLLQNYEEKKTDNEISEIKFITLKVSNICNLVLLVVSGVATLHKIRKY